MKITKDKVFSLTLIQFDWFLVHDGVPGQLSLLGVSHGLKLQADHQEKKNVQNYLSGHTLLN